MANLFSFISWRDKWLHLYFIYSGMNSQLIQVDHETKMHCWVSRGKTVDKTERKPILVLLHGFGANAMWQWHSQIGDLLGHFDLYVPDLIFFGKSYSTSTERSEFFQAESVMKLLKHLGVTKFHLVGISYGGFVAYRLAQLYPEAVQKLVIISSGVCKEPEDGHQLFQTSESRTAADILLPQNPANLRTLLDFSMYKPPRMIPSFLLQDIINTMYTDQREQKVELLQQVVLGKEGAPLLPVLNQKTLIIWGDHDRVFPLELGHRLKRHLGDTAELMVVKDAGHAVQLEKPDEVNRGIKLFLLNSC
eukprot:Gb_03307 [translate_table: standard]